MCLSHLHGFGLKPVASLPLSLPSNVDFRVRGSGICVNELFEDEGVQSVTVAVEVTAADSREHLTARYVGEGQIVLVFEI